MKKIILKLCSCCPLFILLMSGCGSLSEPNFNVSINPYIGGDYSKEFDYKHNSFVKFYDSYFLIPSLQECYKNMPELFLRDGEESMLVNLDEEGSLPKSFKKRYFWINIGLSSYSDNVYGKLSDALEVARVLRAKYLFYGTSLLNEYGTMQGQKVQRKAMTAIFAIGNLDNQQIFNEFSQKCPLLFEEYQEQIKK